MSCKCNKIKTKQKKKNTKIDLFVSILKKEVW